MKVSFYLWFVFLLQLKLININASNSDTIRFAFLTDLHVSPGNVNELKLYDIVDEINSQNLDFVVVTGDLSNTGSNDELLAVQKALDNLQIPLYIIPGNHETNWSESAGMKFNEIWGDDHFDFVFKNNDFIGFNTGPFMKMGDGHVKNEDINWLKNRIKQFNTTQNHLFAFSHYPLNDELENWAEVTQILKQGNCKIVFCGHGHKLSLFNFDGIPGIMGRALFMKKDQSFGYQ
ncbi:MAG: metallophosphoesterase, partial [Bacteroidales bacterium]|nr:metallophosphoesterase [Bacteroidales bacterium]